MPSLSEILDKLGTDTPTEKTASVQTDTANTLSHAVAAADTQTKTAGARPQATPTQDLTKIAQRLATAEQEALIKEAELFGAALCDGFVARMDKYNTAGSGVKVASADSFEKFAAANPELTKQAMELGYRETREKLAHAAQSAYQDGYVKTAEVIKTAAEHCAYKGYRNTLSLLSRVGQR